MKTLTIDYVAKVNALTLEEIAEYIGLLLEKVKALAATENIKV